MVRHGKVGIGSPSSGLAMRVRVCVPLCGLLCGILLGSDPRSVRGEVVTPETRALTASEAEQALQRDWLFQAMGEPLLARSAKEIGWTRQLADRLSKGRQGIEFADELRQLDRFEQRLDALRQSAEPRTPGREVTPLPSWIWYPEGDATRDVPAGVRYFRCRFHLVEIPQRAVLRVACDDACQVFVNGQPIGSHETWQRAAAWTLDAAIGVGENVVAIRAENRPAAGPNPAGLIARLTLMGSDGSERIIVSDAQWRTCEDPPPGWERRELDDADWPPARPSVPWGEGPWGKIAGLGLEAGEDPVAAYALERPQVRELYLAVRALKRRIALRNPLVDFSRLLMIDQPLPQGPINPEHEAIHRMGITAVAGGRLLILDGLHPGGEPRALASDRPGSFWRPDLSFDARKIVFCFKPHDESSFHLYEINLDGTQLRQLTDSPYDDIDPIYLPDGHLLFTSTRGNSYVRCGPFIYSYTLARCDADGSNVYLISHNGEPDFVPALLHDGRVIYSRWEYSDKPLWRLQGLWTTNPDGTGTAHYWGNQSVWPDHLSEPRPIPGSHRVMFSGVGHHDWWSGSIGIVDPVQGRDYPHGLTKVTADLQWPEVSLPPEDCAESPDYHASGRFTGYKTPYPLSEQDFLVSARGLDNKFRLYLMDVHGNRDLIYEGVHNIWHAIPVKPRGVPPRRADQVAWPGTGAERGPVAPGVFFSNDVYAGVPDLPRGLVRYLRVLQLDYKTYSTWHKTFRHSGPPVSIVQEEGVKRILSEVPVEPDGSVHFQAPAGRALFFQLLDEHRRCVHTMRSFTGLMPGEQRGCLGCHEGHSAAPHPRDDVAMALRRSPTPPSPPSWGTDCISYERFVQPVLDRYCVTCHHDRTADAPQPNLVLRPGHNVFKEPYLTLVGSAGWGNPVPSGGPGYGIAGAIPVESAYDQNDPTALATLRPMQYLSYTSRLIDIASSGRHHDVRVDPESLHRLIAWVDACCPFMGDAELRALGDPDFPGIETLPIRPRVATAPIIDRP